MSNVALRRLQTEYREFPKASEDFILVEDDEDIVDLTRWKVRINGAKGTIYEGEHFFLRVNFYETTS